MLRELDMRVTGNKVKRVVVECIIMLMVTGTFFFTFLQKKQKIRGSAHHDESFLEKICNCGLECL